MTDSRPRQPCYSADRILLLVVVVVVVSAARRDKKAHARVALGTSRETGGRLRALRRRGSASNEDTGRRRRRGPTTDVHGRHDTVDDTDADEAHTERRKNRAEKEHRRRTRARSHQSCTGRAVATGEKKGAPSWPRPVGRTYERTNERLRRDARATRNLERSYATTLRERESARTRRRKVRDGSPQKLTRPIQHGGLARRVNVAPYPPAAAVSSSSPSPPPPPTPLSLLLCYPSGSIPPGLSPSLSVRIDVKPVSNDPAVSRIANCNRPS